jgi:polysaccharide export outer membrane protein
MPDIHNCSRIVLQIAVAFLTLAGASAQSSSPQTTTNRIGPIAQPGAPGQDAPKTGVGNSGSPPAYPAPSLSQSINSAGNTGTAPTDSVIFAQPGSAPDHTEVLIGPGDLLEVSVDGAPEYAKQVRVSATGEITLPMAGTVHVGGLPNDEAGQIIANRLSEGGFFNDPRVSVFTKESAVQGVSVLGEVQRPGIYPMPGEKRLFDVISSAGGTTQRAGNTVTITHRSDPQHPQTVTLSYNSTMPIDANIPVHPGDTVMVSKAGIVYVVGDVRVPGGFIMENSQMTIMQAVAMAQGANPTASLNNSKLIRKTGAGSQPQEIPISLKKILSAKIPDVNLQANDIVFVPSSVAKTTGRRTVEAIVQTVSGMAIYGRIP